RLLSAGVALQPLRQPVTVVLQLFGVTVVDTGIAAAVAAVAGQGGFRRKGARIAGGFGDGVQAAGRTGVRGTPEDGGDCRRFKSGVRRSPRAPATRACASLTHRIPLAREARVRVHGNSGGRSRADTEQEVLRTSV